MSDDNKTFRMTKRAASEMLKCPGVQAVVILISVQDADGTKFIRQQLGKLHACEGLLRERLRETEQYEIGYHLERGRYDSVTERQSQQSQEREKELDDQDGDEWKDLE
jgi:hypothetical protein